MKKNIKLFCQLSLLYVVFSSGAIAATLTFENAWSPEAPPVAKVLAGYMKINNISNKEVKIVSANSKFFKRVEIHLTKSRDGMMTMVKQDTLPIAAKGQVELKAGGLHLMLIGPKKSFRNGSVIPLNIKLNNKEILKLKLAVKKDSATTHHHNHEHHH